MRLKTNPTYTAPSVRTNGWKWKIVMAFMKDARTTDTLTTETNLVTKLRRNNVPIVYAELHL